MPPATARAAEAGTHFKRAVELYGEADYTGALIEFRRAYDLDPKFQALYNIGETYFQLQDYANALQTLEKYLRDGGMQVPPGRREEVMREVEKLRTRVARLEIVVNVPDADITVDDVAMGRSPLAPIVVSAGRRKITATKTGQPPVTQIVELAGGDAQRVTLTITDEARPAIVAVPDAPQAQAARVPAAPWIVTGVLAAGGIVTGALALASASTTKSDLAVYPNANPNQISSDHDKTLALGIATDCLLGAAIVTAGVSIYFTVTAVSAADKASPSRASRERRVGFGPAAPARATPAISLSLGAQSLKLGGAF